MSTSTPTTGLEEILDLLNERIARYRVSDLAVVYCNRAWARQHAAEPDELVGRTLDTLLTPAEMAGLHHQLSRLGPDLPFLPDSQARPCSHTPGRWVEWADLWLDAPEGPEVLAVGRDATQRRLTEARLARSEERFRNLAELSADVVWRLALRPRPRLAYVSPSVRTLTGWSPEDFGSDLRHLLDVLDADGRDLVVRAVAGESVPDRVDLRLRTATGERVVLEVQTVRLPDGAQGVARDVTEMRRLQADLRELALRDPLTGLANRRLLEELLDNALGRLRWSHRTVVVTYVDLDGFKPLNDDHGHAFGDAVLVEVARRLESAVRDADVVARVGGDEFVVVHEAPSALAEDTGRRMASAVAAPMVIEGTTVQVQASVGTVVARQGRTTAELVAQADAAMYAAKRRRRAAPGEPAATAPGPSTPLP